METCRAPTMSRWWVAPEPEHGRPRLAALQRGNPPTTHHWRAVLQHPHFPQTHTHSMCPPCPCAAEPGGTRRQWCSLLGGAGAAHGCVQRRAYSVCKQPTWPCWACAVLLRVTRLPTNKARGSATPALRACTARRCRGGCASRVGGSRSRQGLEAQDGSLQPRARQCHQQQTTQTNSIRARRRTPQAQHHPPTLSPSNQTGGGEGVLAMPHDTGFAVWRLRHKLSDAWSV